MGRRYEQTFLQRRHPNGQQTHGKMLHITCHQGNTNQNHNEVSLHVGCRMAKINKTENNECWRGCGDRGTLLHCWWECKVVQPLWKRAWRFPKTLKTELPHNPAIALLGIYPKDTNAVIWGHLHPMFIAAMSTIAKLWKEPRCPSTDERMKMWYLHTMEYYSVVKKMKSCHLQ